eukprot:2126037-Rhodomonas_salina.1
MHARCPDASSRPSGTHARCGWNASVLQAVRNAWCVRQTERKRCDESRDLGRRAVVQALLQGFVRLFRRGDERLKQQPPQLKASGSDTAQRTARRLTRDVGWKEEGRRCLLDVDSGVAAPNVPLAHELGIGHALVGVQLDAPEPERHVLLAVLERLRVELLGPAARPERALEQTVQARALRSCTQKQMRCCIKACGCGGGLDQWQWAG